MVGFWWLFLGAFWLLFVVLFWSARGGFDGAFWSARGGFGGALWWFLVGVGDIVTSIDEQLQDHN